MVDSYQIAEGGSNAWDGTAEGREKTQFADASFEGRGWQLAGGLIRRVVTKKGALDEAPFWLPLKSSGDS